MAPIAVQVNQHGGIVLPPDVRQRHKIQNGDTLYLVQLDDILLLVTKETLVLQLSQEIEQARIEADLSMDDLLRSLRQEREDYVAEKYDL